MTLRSRKITPTLTALLGFIAFSNAAYSGTGDNMVVILPAGEFEAQKTFESRVGSISASILDSDHPYLHTRVNWTALDVSSAVEGFYEVEIALTGIDTESGDWNLEIMDPELEDAPRFLRRIVVEGNGDDEVVVYREMVYGPEKYEVWVNQRPPGGLQDFEGSPTTEETSFTMVVTLRQLNHCTMWAEVTGDVNSVTFGDVAYFNVLDKPVVNATGGTADAELMGMMGDFIEGLGEMGGEASAGANSRSEFEAWIKGQEEGGTERFGLTLMDRKSDLGPMAGLQFLASGFVLEAAGPGSIDYPPGATDIRIELSRLVVAPGGRATGSGDKVKFEWEPGEPGSAELRIWSVSENVLCGIVEGDLFTKKHYDGKRLRIKVRAKFASLRGALSCKPQM